MANSLRFNGSAGFQFSRPTVGRIGTADDLHPNVLAALDTLAARLEDGFRAPPLKARLELEELEAIAQSKEHAAQDAQSRADQDSRSLAEAVADQQIAERELERTSTPDAEAEFEADGQPDVEQQNPRQAKTKTKPNGPAGAHQPEFQKANADAIAALEQAIKKVKLYKEQAEKSSRAALHASEEAKIARNRAQDLRMRSHQSRQRLHDVLSLPIYDADQNIKTLLSTPKPDENGVSLGEIIDSFGDTEEWYAVRQMIAQRSRQLPFNQQALLARSEVVDYMFSRARYALGFTEVEGIYNSIVDPSRGGKFLYDFVTSYALERMRQAERLDISRASKAKMLNRLQDKVVLLRRDSLEAVMKSLAAEFLYGDKELALVLEAEEKLGIDIPDSLQLALVDYIRRTNANGEQINLGNAPFFLSIALAKLQHEEVVPRSSAINAQVGTEDYQVDYYEDLITTPEYDRASVEAAAQMYLTMVWGDMLGIFQTVDRIAMQAPIAGLGPILLEIRSRQLSDDLRMYVLDEEYQDRKTGRISRRISPTERQMFYRQLFGMGEAQVVADEQVNPDFQRYWSVLMMEVVKYIGKVEENGENYRSISSSKVYQAIEDLQYNLSAYCTGLPKIAAPSMYAELDFVIQRILNSDDVKQQLGRRGAPSFWKVIEQVRGMQDFTPLRNKGIFGHKIISTIARATPSLLEDQPAFEEFIANVEAFIVAEDQLAEAGAGGATPGFQIPGFFGNDTGGFLPTDGGAIPGMNGTFPGMPRGMLGAPAGGRASVAAPGSNRSGASADDWNF
ncbi:MAG: hypothetical protein ACK587_06665 [Cyanobacteriota bacterium]